MCNKFTVLTLAYVVIFITVVKCEDSASSMRIANFVSKGKFEDSSHL